MWRRWRNQCTCDNRDVPHAVGCLRWMPVSLPHYTCPQCGMTSYNPNDIEQGYCGNCHDWTAGLAALPWYQLGRRDN